MICGIRHPEKQIKLLLLVYIYLYCWCQSFNVNLHGDMWCVEDDKVFWLSLLCDLSSSAASFCFSYSSSDSLYTQEVWLCSSALTDLTDKQLRLMLPRLKTEEEWQLCQGRRNMCLWAPKQWALAGLLSFSITQGVFWSKWIVCREHLGFYSVLFVLFSISVAFNSHAHSWIFNKLTKHI